MDERAWKLLALMRSSRMKMSLVTNWLLLWALGPSLTLSVCLFIYMCFWTRERLESEIYSHPETHQVTVLQLLVYSYLSICPYVCPSVRHYIILFIGLSIILSAGMSFCLINNSGKIQSQIRFLARLKPNVHLPRVLWVLLSYFSSHHLS